MLYCCRGCNYGTMLTFGNRDTSRTTRILTVLHSTRRCIHDATCRRRVHSRCHYRAFEIRTTILSHILPLGVAFSTETRPCPDPSLHRSTVQSSGTGLPGRTAFGITKWWSSHSRLRTWYGQNSRNTTQSSRPQPSTGNEGNKIPITETRPVTTRASASTVGCIGAVCLAIYSRA